MVRLVEDMWRYILSRDVWRYVLCLVPRQSLYAMSLVKRDMTTLLFKSYAFHSFPPHNIPKSHWLQLRNNVCSITKQHLFHYATHNDNRRLMRFLLTCTTLTHHTEALVNLVKQGRYGTATYLYTILPRKPNPNNVLPHLAWSNQSNDHLLDQLLNGEFLVADAGVKRIGLSHFATQGDAVKVQQWLQRFGEPNTWLTPALCNAIRSGHNATIDVLLASRIGRIGSFITWWQVCGTTNVPLAERLLNDPRFQLEPNWFGNIVVKTSLYSPDARLLHFLLRHLDTMPTEMWYNEYRQQRLQRHLQTFEGGVTSVLSGKGSYIDDLWFCAIKRGHIPILMCLIKHRDFRRVFLPSFEHLRLSIELGGDPRVVSFLIQLPEFSTWLTPMQQRHLRWIAYGRKNQIRDVMHMIQHDDVDPSIYQNVALRMAARYGYVKLIQHLLRDVRTNAKYALAQACEYCMLHSVEALLKDTRLRSDDIAEALYRAVCTSRSTIIVKRLLQDPRTVVTTRIRTLVREYTTLSPKTKALFQNIPH